MSVWDRPKKIRKKVGTPRAGVLLIYRQREPTAGGKMSFPCRVPHLNSCWKHQELWMLVGVASRCPSCALKYTLQCANGVSFKSNPTCRLYAAPFSPNSYQCSSSSFLKLLHLSPHRQTLLSFILSANSHPSTSLLSIWPRHLPPRNSCLMQSGNKNTQLFKSGICQRWI